MSNEVLSQLQFDTQPFESYTVYQWKENRLRTVDDQLAEEVPVALVYNGISHAVMLATPQDLEDFALGFSLTEGIVESASEVYEIDVRAQSQGIELHLTISSQRFSELKQRRRSMVGRTGCGLCGAESLAQVFREPAHKSKEYSVSIRSENLLKAHQNMYAGQPLQHATGATHACAWADENGNIHVVREDVGRHNALDKLIGTLLKDGKTGGIILTTSRASYEMVQKVAMAGYEILSAISAPTGLAVRMANQYHLTLLGFVRDQQYVIYSHPSRIEHTII
jgi:FdhD protein